MKDRLGKALMRTRIKTVLPHIQGRLLDVGCGTNELVRAYGGPGTGVDVFPWEGVDLVVEDSAELPFEDGSFDTVTVIAALNHIPERDRLLRELHRLLSAQGRLVVTMIPPTISRVWHFLRSPWDVDQNERGMVEGEVYGISAGAMDAMLAAAGFERVHASRFMLGFNRLSTYRRTG
ncbi:MAG: methyltransferase domain-containing protein [Acidobacteriota bacterium]